MTTGGPSPAASGTPKTTETTTQQPSKDVVFSEIKTDAPPQPAFSGHATFGSSSATKPAGLKLFPSTGFGQILGQSSSATSEAGGAAGWSFASVAGGNDVDTKGKYAFGARKDDAVSLLRWLSLNCSIILLAWLQVRVLTLRPQQCLAAVSGIEQNMVCIYSEWNIE